MDGKLDDSQSLGEPAEGEEARRKRGRPAQPHCCQVCGRNLEVEGSRYHKRYRICPPHMMADSLVLDGVVQRFCQQCGRFHTLEAFEGTKRSCREQLEKQALRRRLARRAAATRSHGPTEQSGGSPAAYSGSSGAGRSGEHEPGVQQRVQAEQLFEAVEARAANAATAPPPPPPAWLAGPLPPRPVSAAEQLAALLLQQQQAQQLAAPPGPLPDGKTPPSQQQLLQQYGSDQSQQSLLALARAMSANTAAPLPSPVAPITPASADDLVQTPQQQAAAALLPALAQPSLSPLLQALLALAPVQLPPPQLPPPVQQPAPPPLPVQLPAPLPLPSVPPLPLQQLAPPVPLQQLAPPVPAPPPPLQQMAPPLLPQLATQQPAPGPYTQQLMNQMLALNQQRVLAQQRAQRSEDELAALVRAVVQFLTALSGAPPAPPAPQTT